MTTMGLAEFAEVRANLSLIASKAMGLLALEALHQAIKDLKSIRERLFVIRPVFVKKIVIDVEPDDTETDKVIEKIIEIPEPDPEPLITPQFITQRARSVSTSTTYNTELTLPYKVLWAKVIIRAAYDFALWKDSSDIRLRRFAEDAARWLFEPSDEDLELSFENICFAFDFPIEKIRKRARILTREDVKKLEFRERERRSESEDFSNGDDK